MRASCEITYGRLAEFQPPVYQYSSLTLGADGCAYTVSVDWSSNGGQQLQRIDAEGRIETVVIFGVDNDLKAARPWLVKGPDGSLYGSATKSTPTPHAVIYRLTPAGLVEEVGNGDFVAVPVFGADGALYGCTDAAGISRLRTDGVMETVPGSDIVRPANGGAMTFVRGADDGLYFNTSEKLWKIGTDGVLSEVARFDYESPTYSTLGAYLGLDNPLVRGKSGTIYGISYGGGPEERGVVFKITSTGAVEPVVAIGSEPGRVDGYTYMFNFAEGAGGTLYQLTNPAIGGHSAFAIDAAGYATMIGSLPATNVEWNKLVTGSDDEVYAAYCAGDYPWDVMGKRTIFKLSTATGCTVVGQTPEPEFLDGEQIQSTPIVGPDGGVWTVSSQPYGQSFAHLIRLRTDGTFEEPLLVSGTALPGKNPTDLRPLSDGSIVGVSGGHPSGPSSLFKIQQDGSIRFLTDLRGALTAPVEFDDGSLVGVSVAGGVGYGSVYRVEPNGRRSIVHFSAGGFPGPVPSPNGAYPTPLVKGSDGAWYGLTRNGGFFDGHVFKVTPSFDVQSVPTFYGDPLHPVQSFVDGGDGALYAISATGGAYGAGGLIRFVPGEFGGELSLVTSFSEPVASSAPSAPSESSSQGPKLVLGGDGWFYGVTNYKPMEPGDMSEVGPGFVFRVNKTGAFEVMARFTGQTGSLLGAKPRPFLTLAADGFFYGVTESGGIHNAGTVFRVNPAGRVVNIASFTGTTGRIAGASPTTLIRRGNVLFGACAKGGASDSGTLFRIDGGRYVTVIETLTGIGGATPGGAPNTLTLGLDGDIYGTGGSDSLAGSNSPLGLYGTVFRLEITDPPAS